MMAIRLSLYSDTDQRQWDSFVWKANNGTLFHTRRFLSYHPAGRFQDNSLLFYEGENLLALLPAVFLERDGKRVLSSHCGSSYGGFVYRENLSIRSAFDLVSALVDYAQKHKIDRIELTFPPVIYLKRLSHYLDFALYKQGFTFKKREISSIIPLDFSRENILKAFKPEARTAYRKSLKSGVTVRSGGDMAEFYPILEQNLALRHEVKPTHTLDELIKLKVLFPRHIHQYGAYYEGKMVAGVTNFLCNDRVMLAFYISHLEDYQCVRPVNHLFYHIIEWGIDHAFKYLDFGIFTVNENPNWGLGKFKESFGARGIFREYYALDL
jgi:hypothetical protein